MDTVIEGIPVVTDSILPMKKITTLVQDIKETWEWEGRSIGRIELKHLSRRIQVSIYEQAPTIFLTDL